MATHFFADIKRTLSNESLGRIHPNCEMKRNEGGGFLGKDRVICVASGNSKPINFSTP